MAEIINLDKYRKKRGRKEELPKSTEKFKLLHFSKVPREVIKGDLRIGNIETYKYADTIIFVLKFSGGGSKILKLLDDFYSEYESIVTTRLNATGFSIVFDGDYQKFIAQIILPIDSSEQKKKEAEKILKKLKQKLIFT
jgi:hypothetical protein